MSRPAGPHDDDSASSAAAVGSAMQRLDKWLWFARVIKSRTLAAGLVTDGRVRINRVKASKPSQMVKPGDVLTISVGARVRILRMVAPGVRRGPAEEARGLFEDLTPPPPASDSPPLAAPEQRQPGAGRPTKRDRRLTDRLKSE